MPRRNGLKTLVKSRLGELDEATQRRMSRNPLRVGMIHLHRSFIVRVDIGSARLGERDYFPRNFFQANDAQRRNAFRKSRLRGASCQRRAA